MSTFPPYQAAARIARAHSRLTLVAASAAAAGVLGTTGFAISAAVGGSQPASGQSGEFLSKSLTGTKSVDGTQAGSVRLDDQRGLAAGMAAGHESAPVGKPAAQPILAYSHQLAATKPAGAQPQAAKAQVAKAQPARQMAAKKPAVKPHPAKPKAPAGPTSPYHIYDSVQPAAIPAGQEAAVYATGGFAASAASVAGHNSVLWIDTRGTDPQANALDVEPGDATPSSAAQWAQQRLSAHPHAVAIVYTMRSEWQQVKDNIATLPGWMQPKVRYWIADPTGYDHIVPGSDATQWYWGSNYDISTASPTFNR